jgi:hypothetical protein
MHTWRTKKNTALTLQVIARSYVPDVRPEGTTASSKGFSYVYLCHHLSLPTWVQSGGVICDSQSRGIADSDSQREQAEEGGYIRKRELEKLKAAQEKVKAAQQELVSVFRRP